MSLSHAVPGEIEPERLARRLVRGIRVTCFWLGVVLPVVYLPLLFVSIEAFVAMLPVHAISLAIGYDHAP